MATRPSITVKYKNPSSGSPTTVTAPIQRVSWNSGRANITDDWQAGVANIYGREPDTLFGSGATSGPVIGDVVQIAVSDGVGQTAYFYGAVADARILYGLTTAYDTWELRIEGRYASLGRNVATIGTSAGASTGDMAQSIQTEQTNTQVYVSSGWGSTTSAQTITGQLSNAVNDLMATEQGVVREYGALISGGPNYDAYAGLFGRNSTEILQLGSNVLSDTSATVYGVTPHKYEQIEFLSAAQNYSTKIVVNADGFAAQSSGTGQYVQSIETINGSASEAANVAGYVKTQLDLNGKVPYSVRFTGANNAVACVSLADQAQVKDAAVVVFRGTQYDVVIEGLQFDATAEDWECVWSLSSSTANAFLRLDDTVYGRLDYNKLGF